MFRAGQLQDMWEDTGSQMVLIGFVTRLLEQPSIFLPLINNPAIVCTNKPFSY